MRNSEILESINLRIFLIFNFIFLSPRYASSRPIVLAAASVLHHAKEEYCRDDGKTWPGKTGFKLPASFIHQDQLEHWDKDEMYPIGGQTGQARPSRVSDDDSFELSQRLGIAPYSIYYRLYIDWVDTKSLARNVPDFCEFFYNKFKVFPQFPWTNFWVHTSNKKIHIFFGHKGLFCRMTIKIQTSY